MSKEITKDAIERWHFKWILLTLLFAAGVGANAIGYGLYWFVGAGAIFLVAGTLYVFNLGRLKIRAKDASSLASDTWGRQFVNLILMSLAFVSGIIAGYLGAGGLWKWAIAGGTFTIIHWLYVKGRFATIAQRLPMGDPKGKKEKEKLEKEEEPGEK
jgi:hypothetical protein